MKNGKIKLISICVVILLMFSACAGKKFLYKSVLTGMIRPLPAKLTLAEVEFEVINVGTNTWFSLDTHNYANLADNIAEVYGYTKKLRYIIEEYEMDAKRLKNNKVD